MDTAVPSSRKPRRVLPRTVATLGLALALGSATMTSASADYYSGGMPSRSWNVRAVGINSTWVGFLDTGRSHWNNSGAGTSLGRSTSAASTFTAARYDQSWFGLYSPSGIRGINRTFAIKVNAKTLSEQSGSNMTAWSISTTTHELGHGLSLADNPNTSSSSLMKHSRNRTTVQRPQSYDVSEVERIY
jgi:hypothetical protein